MAQPRRTDPGRPGPRGRPAVGRAADQPGRGRRRRSCPRSPPRSRRTPGKAQVVGLTGSPGVGKSTTTNELVRALRAGRPPGRRARRRPVQPVHRRRDPRRPDPDAGAHHRPGRLHPLDVQPGPARRPGRGHPAGGPGAGGRRLRRDPGRDGRRRAGRGGDRLAGRHHAGAARARAWATRSRRSRRASWRSPTSSWSTRRTGRAPTPRTATSRACSALGERAPGEWRPQVVRAVAVKNEGIDDVVAAIEKHRGWLDSTGELRQTARAAGRRRGRGDRAGHAACPDGLACATVRR